MPSDRAALRVDFVTSSYANRVGKGTHRALNRAELLARRHRFVLQCDLRQFFPSFDHAVLRTCLARTITDTRVLALIDLILASGEGILDGEYDLRFFEGDDLLASLRPRGLPIGNLTSQFWANVYMNPFDHFVTRELGCTGYVRYVDDMLLFVDDKATLGRWRHAVVDRPPRLSSAPASEATEGHAFRQAVAGSRRGPRPGQLFDGRDQCDGAWVNHVRHGSTYGLRRALLSTCRLGVRPGSP